MFQALRRLYAGRVVALGGVPAWSAHLDARLQAVASWLTAGPTRGLMLAGPCGTGKTVTLQAVGALVEMLGIPCVQGRWHSTYSLRLVSARAVAEAALRPGGFELMRDLASAPLLAIDDLGSEPAELMTYGRVMRPVADLLEERYSRSGLTLVSGNVTPAALAAAYGERVADRFNEWMTTVVYAGLSYRRAAWEARMVAGGAASC